MSDKEKMLKGLDELKAKDVKSWKLSEKEKNQWLKFKIRRRSFSYKRIIKMEMGGEVMDMTKAQPVGMMDGGKIKKMNMGGVVPGRGGQFKGMK